MFGAHPRSYTKNEIQTHFKFPTGTYIENNERELKYEWIINDSDKNCYAIVIRSAIPSTITNELFKECERDCRLQINNTIANKTYPQPRLNCVYSDGDISKMKYSGTQINTIPWSPLMLLVKNYVTRDGFSPNSCLVNGYLNDKHYVDYHRDKDLRDGRNIVATISLGGTRIFSFCEIKTLNLLPPVFLNDGDLVFFYGSTNDYYKHSIIKTPHFKDVKTRYSLTYRIIDKI